MPFRFRKSIKILPGVKINLSKSGVSTSVGKRGATVNFSKRGTRTTIGIPGTGLSYSSQTSTPKTTPQINRPYDSNSGGANNNGSCLGLITFPFRFMGDLIKGISKPETRKSTSIILGIVVIACLGCFGLSSILGSNSAQPSPSKTPIAAIVSAQTKYSSQLTQQSAPTITFTPTALFPEVSVQDYPRVASARYQTLKEAFAEFLEIHKQLMADPSVSQNNDWYLHANAVLERIVAGTNELASMSNYPPAYTDFYQAMQNLAVEVNTLEANYTAALDNQDVNAINQATANLGNSITYLNQASGIMQALNPSPTPLPSQTPLPTATYVVVYPTQPPSSGGGVGYDTNGDGKVTCADFKTQAAAQEAYNAGYTKLDGNDKDGKACESLP